MRLRSRTPRSFSDVGGMTDGRPAHSHTLHTSHTSHTYLPQSEGVWVSFFPLLDVWRQCSASLIALTFLHSQSNVKTGMQAPHFTADRKKRKKKQHIRHSRFFTNNRATKFKPIIWQWPTILKHDIPFYLILEFFHMFYNIYDIALSWNPPTRHICSSGTHSEI